MDDCVHYSPNQHDPVSSETTYPAPQEGKSLSGPQPPGLAIDSLVHAEAERHVTPQTVHS